MKKSIIVIFLFSGIAGISFSLYMHREKYSPLNDPDVPIMQTAHYPALFVKQLQGDPEAGKKIFREYCSTCHGKEPVIDIQAPRINDKKAWKKRKKLGISTLLKKTIEGAKAMPARGGCFECSDDQLRETIRYILKKSSGSC